MGGTRPPAVDHDGARDRIFAEQVERSPQFGVYQEKTSRVTPVVALRRAA
jgi:hypothetical protein